MNNDIRNLTKWLNEEQESPIDRQALARVLAMAEQPAQQEPVAWLDPWTQNNVTTDYYAYGKHGIPLYRSTPPQRKPLTDDEIEKMCPKFEDPMRREMWMIGFKAAHGIKENT